MTATAELDFSPVALDFTSLSSRLPSRLNNRPTAGSRPLPEKISAPAMASLDFFGQDQLLEEAAPGAIQPVRRLEATAAPQAEAPAPVRPIPGPSPQALAPPTSQPTAQPSTQPPPQASAAAVQKTPAPPASKPGLKPAPKPAPARSGPQLSGPELLAEIQSHAFRQQQALKRLQAIENARKTGLELVAARRDLLTLESSLKTLRSKYRLGELREIKAELANSDKSDRKAVFIAVKNRLGHLYTGELAPEDGLDLIQDFLRLQVLKGKALSEPEAAAQLARSEQSWLESLKPPGSLFPLEKVALTEVSQALTEWLAPMLQPQTASSATADTPAPPAVEAEAEAPRSLHAIQSLLFKARSDARRDPSPAHLQKISRLESELGRLMAEQRQQALLRTLDGLRRHSQRLGSLREKIPAAADAGVLRSLHAEALLVKDKVIKELNLLNPIYASRQPVEPALNEGLQRLLALAGRLGLEPAPAPQLSPNGDETAALQSLLDEVARLQQALHDFQGELSLQQDMLSTSDRLAELEGTEDRVLTLEKQIDDLVARMEAAAGTPEQDALLEELIERQNELLDLIS